MKYFLILTLACCLGNSAYTQKVKFIEHLVESNYFEEALRELERINWSKYQTEQTDSLHYYKGWSLYSLKQLNNSSLALLEVTPGSGFYAKSRYFSAYNQAHIGSYKNAKDILSSLQPNSENEKNLRLFLHSGIDLLERNFSSYDSLSTKMDDDFFAYAQEKKKIELYSMQLRNRKVKKPWVAGLMSGIIPGSGKIYAGKTGEGIASMLMVSSLGLVTWENYRKAGPRHFKTILFGSIFSLFYIGNIYGSVFSVKLSNEEFAHEMDHKILFNLHIPLRTFFN